MTSNGTIPDLPEAVSRPPDGVVLPPKDIRAIIEKTAGYVARNGTVFEDRIRDKEQSNSKFSFLNPQDAYAPFYQWRLSEVRSGRGTAVSAGRAGDATPVREKPKGPEPPPEFQFSARIPNISASDLEVVKLTALHVARKGKSWMTALAAREARNFQFDFLRPQHSLYNFFQRLVDQYTILLQTGPEGQKAEQVRIQTLQANIQDRFRVLNLAKKRAEYVKWQETQKQKKEEAEEAERLAYAQVDWHDFVVVETVLFTEADDQTDLPPPTTLNDLQSASLEQKAMMSLARPDMRIEEAMPTSDMDYAYGGGYADPYAQQQQHQHQPQNGYGYPAPAPPEVSMPTYMPSPIPPQPSPVPFGPTAQIPAPYSPAPPAIPSPQPTASPAPIPGQAPMRIKQDYIPRAQQRAANSRVATALCPNCGQQIAVSELDAHLRIELLDPRWKEQQAKATARFSTTNLGGTDVAANLKRLRARTDGPGAPAAGADPVAEAAARVLGEQEEEERRKRMRLDGGAGGGVPPGQQGQGQGLQPKNVQEQIQRIHSKYGS
nr:SF3a splicing factor complex subunit [Exophiala xenobiotica]